MTKPFRCYDDRHAMGLHGKLINLRLSWRSLPLQLLIGITGILLGSIECLILHPEPLLVPVEQYHAMLRFEQQDKLAELLIDLN